MKTILLTLAVMMPLASLMPAEAGEVAKVLKWADLVPPAAAAPVKPKSFFSEVPKKVDDGAPPPPFEEGKFMAMKRRQPGGEGPPKVVDTLNGTRVQLGGYIVPLDFEATKIKEFLLVPFVGACIHVPPPPANQIVFVKSADGLEISGSFEPVTVTGMMKTETAFTGLADAGYTIEADQVEIIKQ